MKKEPVQRKAEHFGAEGASGWDSGCGHPPHEGLGLGRGRPFIDEGGLGHGGIEGGRPGIAVRLRRPPTP